MRFRKRLRQEKKMVKAMKKNPYNKKKEVSYEKKEMALFVSAPCHAVCRLWSQRER